MILAVIIIASWKWRHKSWITGSSSMVAAGVLLVWMVEVVVISMCTGAAAAVAADLQVYIDVLGRRCGLKNQRHGLYVIKSKCGWGQFCNVHALLHACANSSMQLHYWTEQRICYLLLALIAEKQAGCDCLEFAAAAAALPVAGHHACNGLFP